MRLPRRLLLAAMVLLLPPGCGRSGPAPEGRTISAAAAAAERVDLLAMGDWGTGRAPQRAVARALRDHVRSSDARIDGMLLAGDNFYVRLRGTGDPQWQTLFERMYDPDVLDFPFYAALGNHDYEQDKARVQLAYAREHPRSRWKLPSPWYRIDFPRDRPLVTVLVLDSNRSRMPLTHWHAQNAWLRDQLRQRDTLGTWVVVCAHHPLFSNGAHGDIRSLQRSWGPLFEEHGVDFYVAGHDHDLQHLQIRGWHTSFILCGGGGAGTRAMGNDRRGPFSRSIHGFAHFTFTPDRAMVRYIDTDGTVVHAFERGLDGEVEVLETTGREVAPPRSIRGAAPLTQPSRPGEQ